MVKFNGIKSLTTTIENNSVDPKTISSDQVEAYYPNKLDEKKQRKRCWIFQGLLNIEANWNKSHRHASPPGDVWTAGWCPFWQTKSQSPVKQSSCSMMELGCQFSIPWNTQHGPSINKLTRKQMMPHLLSFVRRIDIVKNRSGRSSLTQPLLRERKSSYL